MSPNIRNIMNEIDLNSRPKRLANPPLQGCLFAFFRPNIHNLPPTLEEPVCAF